MLMDVYPQSNNSFDHEFLLAKLKDAVSQILYKSLSALN